MGTVLLVLLGLGTAVAVTRREDVFPVTARIPAWPQRALKFKDIFLAAVAKHRIPLPILLAWGKRESDFNPLEYNPEKGAMRSWSCAVAGNPSRWRTNPDYEHAVTVCQSLSAGATPESMLSIWTFGSYGLFQVSRIGASEKGGYPYASDNSGLYHPQTNTAVATRYIAKVREALYPGRQDLTLTEWARLRAAYVGGRGILTSNPRKANQIAQEFIETVGDLLRGPANV